MTKAEVTSTEPALTQVQRVIYTFTAPSKTFTDILHHSRNVLLPILLIIVGSYIFTFSAAKRVGYEGLAESAIKANPKMEERVQGMTAEQVATLQKQQAIGMKITVYSFPVVFVIFGALYALLFWGTLNFGFGGEATYGGLFAVVLYSFLVGLGKFLLAALMLWVTDPPEIFTFQDPVGTNLGYYLDRHSGPLYALLTSIDIFEIWEFIVLGIGCAIVAKLTIRKGMIAVFIWWTLFTILKIGFAAAFS
ncbi:YIP1 family protein [Terriglobus albidus]|uniref:YIP1 family protein n=1 Tax=Terriglobus albidus TaxID=1592106 RepID=UPI0021DF6A7F|nr:YIP1 family protein [Terriglobus albidus]